MAPCFDEGFFGRPPAGKMFHPAGSGWFGGGDPQLQGGEDLFESAAGDVELFRKFGDVHNVDADTHGFIVSFFAPVGAS